MEKNAKAIWDYLKKQGLNDYAVAGVMGNLKAESTLNPKNLQNSYEKRLGYTDETYTAAVDNGSYKNFARDAAGYGLAQWTYWTRKQALYDFAKKEGESIGSLSMQLNFLWRELQGYKNVIGTLKTASSIRQASDVILLQFERPADQSEAVQKRRAAYGQEYYDAFANVQRKTVEELAKEVIDGKWGNGADRKERLAAAGYDFAAVQKKVNELLKTPAKKSTQREKVVATMQSWVGRKEADGSHKAIIDLYNSHKPLARGYKVKYTDAWCATCVSAVSIANGLTAIMPLECSCAKMIELYIKLGRWVENDAYTPQAGDVIFYDWQDSGVGDNTGQPDHVGIVERVAGGIITVIEGNCNDAVGRRNIKVNGRYIRGYGVPDYK